MMKTISSIFSDIPPCYYGWAISEQQIYISLTVLIMQMEGFFTKIVFFRSEQYDNFMDDKELPAQPRLN